MSAGALRRLFDVPSRFTLGLEEEVMLLDPGTLDLLPRAAAVLARVRDDPAVKAELPASQLELLTAPCHTVGEAAGQLHDARQRLAAAAAGIGRLAAAGVHPFAAADGELTPGPHYERMRDEYGWVARRQLVFGLHVHVAVRPAERALAVYNALRAYLPELAALAANAPFHAGADTGLASVRPKLSELLPRQGVPPAFSGLDDLAAALAWARRAGALTDARQWWWELRLHPALGTIEVRACDAQPTVGRTAALAATIHALCAWLADRHDGGDLPPPAATWRIEANRWSACRHGLRGTMADLASGAPAPTAERIATLLSDLGPAAARLGCASELEQARALLSQPADAEQRQVAAERGLRGLVDWLASRFLEPVAG